MYIWCTFWVLWRTHSGPWNDSLYIFLFILCYCSCEDVCSQRYNYNILHYINKLMLHYALYTSVWFNSFDASEYFQSISLHFVILKQMWCHGSSLILDKTTAGQTLLTLKWTKTLITKHQASRYRTVEKTRFSSSVNTDSQCNLLNVFFQLPLFTCKHTKATTVSSESRLYDLEIGALHNFII